MTTRYGAFVKLWELAVEEARVDQSALGELVTRGKVRGKPCVHIAWHGPTGLGHKVQVEVWAFDPTEVEGRTNLYRYLESEGRRVR
jgi:hypothetical protein